MSAHDENGLSVTYCTQYKGSRMSDGRLKYRPLKSLSFNCPVASFGDCYSKEVAGMAGK